ncbi:MAG: FMN-binding protein [Phycisphaerae bacterium]|nr:FMN-binding protein [Phycisphaerae bacterium]
MKFLKQGWLVLVLAVVFGVGLTAVDRTLGPKIAENQKNETYGQIANLVPGGAAANTKEVRIGGQTVLKVYNTEGEHVGWVIPATGMGYSDAIKALLGLDAQARSITGIYILDQKETPGLGSKITTDWNRQYVGKTILPPLTVVKTTPTKENEIKAISGATISSNSLTDIVNRAAEAFAKALTADATAKNKGQ